MTDASGDSSPYLDFGWRVSVSHKGRRGQVEGVLSREAHYELADDEERLPLLPLWFSVSWERGLRRASGFWTKLDQAPDELVLTNVGAVAAVLLLRDMQLEVYRTGVLHLMADSRVEDEIVEPFLNLPYFAQHPLDLLSVMRSSLADRFGDLLAPDLIEQLWQPDLELELPPEFERQTMRLLGSSKHEQLRTAREVYREAVRRKQQEREKRKAEIAAAREKYSTSRAGIRNDPLLRTVCVECGSDNVYTSATGYGEGPGLSAICRDCGARWYVNHCWHCHARVDSRDPETPKCPDRKCGWYICHCCGACSEEHTVLRQLGLDKSRTE